MGALTENSVPRKLGRWLSKVFSKWDLVSPSKRARYCDSQGHLIIQYYTHFLVLPTLTARNKIIAKELKKNHFALIPFIFMRMCLKIVFLSTRSLPRASEQGCVAGPIHTH